MIISFFAETSAETQTIWYAALRLQGWNIARQEPIEAQAIFRFRDFAITQKFNSLYVGEKGELLVAMT